MRNTYSLYDAKAKLSAIIRRVREGQTAVITHHGQPVAEIRPFEAGRGGLDARLADLESRGIIVRASGQGASIPGIVKRQGAVKRFLAERD